MQRVPEGPLTAPLAELAAAGRLVLDSPSGEVAVFYVEGDVYAVDNRCPHAGNPLVEGDVRGRTLVCAYHDWRFDLPTGFCLAGNEAVRAYPVERRGDVILIHLG